VRPTPISSVAIRDSKRLVAGVAMIAALLALPAHAFDLQGHRGAGALAPENTLPAYKRALEIGVDTLECDMAIRRTESS